MIRKYSSGIPYIISRFKHHEEFKDKVLKLIENQESVSIKEIDESISRADWNIDCHRKYWDFLFPYIERHMEEVFSTLNAQVPKFSNVWFQQYYSADRHGWHVHGDCFWANVYYLELPNGTPPTVFKNINEKDQFILPEVTEGDIITFPSLMEHCSPENKSNLRKTVIAFNML